MTAPSRIGAGSQRFRLVHRCTAFLPYVSVALYALLVVEWLTDATRTTRGPLNGRLFPPARASVRRSLQVSPQLGLDQAGARLA